MPFPYKRILCSIDFDGSSGLALEAAAVMALGGEATVCVFHAVHINQLVDQGVIEGLAAGVLYEPQLEYARKKVDQMLVGMPAELKREIMIEIGDPGTCIIKAVTKIGADLMVTATHGRRGLKHLALGSVAERVVCEAPVPVLTVRAAP